MTINYRELGNEVVDAYIYSDGIYNGGPRTSDPRGRNNRGDLSKIELDRLQSYAKLINDTNNSP